MKATFQIPDSLYREVKAQTAREGRTLREVTVGLFEQWLSERKLQSIPTAAVDWKNFQSPLAHLVPDDVSDHSMESITNSIAQNWDESN